MTVRRAVAVALLLALLGSAVIVALTPGAVSAAPGELEAGGDGPPQKYYSVQVGEGGTGAGELTSGTGEVARSAPQPVARADAPGLVP